MALDLTIVVPAYNEAHRLAEGIRRLDVAVDEGAVDLDRTEILLVDDGSTDGTAETAGKLLAPTPHHRVVRCPANRGKGAAVRAGLALARGANTAFMDADMAIDPRAVAPLLSGLEEADVVIGSRALAGSMVEHRYVVRSLMGGAFNRLVTMGTGLRLHDTQCGFKGFRTPVGRLLFHLVPIDRFAFDVEILALAHRLGLAVTEVPVHWKHVAGSSVHPLHDSVSMLADVVGFRLGVHAAAPVPALALRDPSGIRTRSAVADAAAEVLGASLPERRIPVAVVDGDVLALLPLEEPAGIQAVADLLESGLPGLAVTRRAVSARALERSGPLAGALVGST